MSLSINVFLDRFGTDTSSNFDLLSWSRELGFNTSNKPKLYVVMKDEIENLKKLKTKSKPLYIITNLHTSKQPGVHWTALYRDGLTNKYFDSYGLQPDHEVIDFLEDGVYSTFQIQPMNTKCCGQLCLYLLYKLSKGKDFYDTVLEMNDYFNSKKWTSVEDL